MVDRVKVPIISKFFGYLFKNFSLRENREDFLDNVGFSLIFQEKLIHHETTAIPFGYPYDRYIAN